MGDVYTLGVEEEYHLVDPETWELRSRSRVVRAEDRSGEVEGEVQDSMLEIGTPTCTSAAEVDSRLRERRFQASAAAAVEGLEILAAGAHPFSRWQDQKLSDGERPRMLRATYRQVIRQQHICGMHVHVAIPAELDRVRLMNVVRAYTPHLIALSCSSPFHLGEDTGFASFRSIIWRGFPFAGTPPHFESADEYEAYLELLIGAGIVPDKRTVYWSIRPSARYPTLELRACDVCPRVADAVAIAALARALVVAAAEDRIQPIGSSISPCLQDEILAENEWVAARDGLEAVLVAPESSGNAVPVRDALVDLLDQLMPTLRELGDDSAIEGVSEILRIGNPADRMRTRHSEAGDMRDLVQWLVEETRLGTGLDRRTRTRRSTRPQANREMEEG